MSWTLIGGDPDAIVGTVGATDMIGGAVSISSDGNTLAVGEPVFNSSEGRVRVFTRDAVSGGWSQPGVVVASGTVGATDMTGISVSSSSDGNTLAVVDDQHFNLHTGRVRVFTRDAVSGAWSPEPDASSNVVATGGGNIDDGDSVGAVSISGDGNTIVFGNRNVGTSSLWRVWVLTKTAGGGWTPRIELAPVSNGGSAQASPAVSVSYDGSVVVFGTPGFIEEFNGTVDIGRVTVYTRGGVGVGWSAGQTGVVVASGTVGSTDRIDIAVSISSDGNTLAVGELGFNSNEGRVRVFTRDAVSGGWSQTGVVVASGTVGATDRTGVVSISSDGNTLAVGEPYFNSGEGRVRVFTRDAVSGGWSQTGVVVASGTVGATDRTGAGLSISSDGNTLAVGEPFFNDYGGRVRVFGRPPPPTPPIPPPPTTPRLSRHRAAKRRRMCAWCRLIWMMMMIIGIIIAVVVVMMYYRRRPQ